MAQNTNIEKRKGYLQDKKLFSRQQALDLTGLSSGQLSRLDKSGTVRPAKLGDEGRRPTVLYTLSQIWQLKTVAALKNRLSTQDIKIVIEYLQKNGFESISLDSYLIFVKNEIYWVKDEIYWFNADELSEKIIELVDKNKGRITLKVVAPIGQAILDVETEDEVKV